MSRRELQGVAPAPLPPPSKCAKVLYYTWKLCSVMFSHFVMISLVVAYCILGAVTFEKLEAHYEREVKLNISKIRENTTQSIWSMTDRSPYLRQSNWTTDVTNMLQEFENAILFEMKAHGWDGNESLDHVQWTFTGALFYSIIVITTIGYGHIAPKTQTGKVVTIFYAILGIPLMLLCLSNIGDVMASSFRFLYWRVCCYVCTRPPKRKRRSSSRRSVRGSLRRRRPQAAPAQLERAHSDTDFRYRDSGYSSGRSRRVRPAPAQHAGPRPRSQPPTYPRGHGLADYDVENRPAHHNRFERDTFEDDEEEFPKVSLPLQDLEAALKDLDNHQVKMSKQDLRSKSLPRPPKSKIDCGPRDIDFEDSNKELFEMHDLHDVDYENYKERKAREFEERERRRIEREEFQSYGDQGYDPEDDDYEFDNPRQNRMWHNRNQRYRGKSEYYERDVDEYMGDRERGRRARSAVYDHERRWDEERDDNKRDAEPRNRRLRRLHTVDDTMRRYNPSPGRDEWSDEVAAPKRGRATGAVWGSRQSDMYATQAESSVKEEVKPVPIWLCVLLVASYIVVGTFLFKHWEGWPYLDAAYFCFITLTTIGFGDFVPAQGKPHLQSGEDPTAAVHSIALCSLYLLFGIALLAMSFNLVQEEVRANVVALATKLGIIKSKVQDDSDTDY